MRPISIRTEHFRCIDHERLELSDYTVLVGRNGSGKSSFLEAMDFFCSPAYRIAADDFFLRDTSRECLVAVEFSDLTAEQLETFAPYVSGDRLTVTKVAVWDEKTNSAATSYHGNRMRCRDFDHVRALSGRNLLEAYRALTKGDFKELEGQRSEESARDALDAWEAAHPERCELGRDEGRFFGYTNVGRGKLDRYFRFTRIPALMTAAAQCEEGASSTLKLLVDTLVRQNGGSSEVLRDLRSRVEAEYQELLGRPEFDLGPVAAELTRSLQEFVPGTAAEVRWRVSQAVRVAEPTAAVLLSDGEFTSTPQQKGHGLLRAFELAVLGLLSDRAKPRPAEAGGSGAVGTVLLGVDEPELYQHPAQARVIASRLKRLAGSELGDVRVQVICTSHSPLFVTLSDCENIRVVRRGEVGRVRGGASVRSASLARMAAKLAEFDTSESNFTADSLRPRMSCLFHPTLTESVFADFAVLVEGDEDVAMLEGALAARGQDDRFKRMGLFVVGVGGKGNMDRMLLLLQELGVPCYSMFDSDDGKANKPAEVAANTGLNLRVLRLASGDRDLPLPTNSVVGEHCALLNPDIRRAVQAEVGAERWLALRNRYADDLGYEQPSRADKNPVVIGRILDQLASEQRFPRILDEIVAAIAAKARVSLER